MEEVYSIINDAATAYKGIIPEDRYHDPYMSIDELTHELNDGVEFWVYEQENRIIGVMGIQDKNDVSLIRHAYVRTNQRNGGIGTKLLTHLMELTEKPILIGTWAAADWAIKFYQKNGFKLVGSSVDKEKLLKKYWNIPARQIETSVVLVNKDL